MHKILSGGGMGKKGFVSTGSGPGPGGWEPYLGLPATSGYVLASTTGGARSWVNPGTPGTIYAQDVVYINKGFTNVKQALDSLLRVAPLITSMTGGSVNQKGQTVTTVSIGWALSGDTPTHSTLTDVTGFNVNTSANPRVLTGLTLTTDKVYTMTIGDDVQNPSSSSSQTVHFTQKMYYGNSANTSLTSAQVVALNGGNFLTDSRLHTLSMDGGGKYLYICFPAAYGSAQIWVNGLYDASFANIGNMDVTNESGYMESYSIYRSLYTQVGSGIPVQVK